MSKISIKKEHSLDDLTSLAKTTLPLAKQLLGKKGFVEIDILRHWSEIVGLTLSQYSLPQKITFPKNERSGGMLHLLALSGAFAMEIQQKEKQIIEKINTFFGYGAVNKIKIIQTGNLSDFLADKKNNDNVKKILVSKREENYITELTKEIKNADLREKVIKLGLSVMAENSQKEQ